MYAYQPRACRAYPRTVWCTPGIDATGDTPLLAACRMAMDEDAEHEPVRMLLEQRANPDLAPAGVQAPLLLSCAKGATPVSTTRPTWPARDRFLQRQIMPQPLRRLIGRGWPERGEG